jgi:hypothetical protein
MANSEWIESGHTLVEIKQDGHLCKISGPLSGLARGQVIRIGYCESYFAGYVEDRFDELRCSQRIQEKPGAKVAYYGVRADQPQRREGPVAAISPIAC